MTKTKKTLALILCMVMCLSMLPTWAVAEEVNPAEEEVVAELQEENPAESSPTAVFILHTEPEGAYVRVYSLDENGAETDAYPDETGAYILAPGEYCYDVSAEGYQARQGERIQLAAAEAPTEITVVLEPEVQEPAPEEAASEAETFEAEQEVEAAPIPESAAEELEEQNEEPVSEPEQMTAESVAETPELEIKEEQVEAAVSETEANDEPATLSAEETDTAEEAMLQTDTEAEERKSTNDEETADLMASSGTCGPNLTWSLDDSGVLTISGSGKMTDYSERESYNTTLAPWGEEYYKVKRVVINQGVTSIGSYAFHACSYITSAVIPSSVTSIGENAFFGCFGMTSLTLPERGVTSIGSYAFSGCSALTEITIPKTVTTIGDGVFSSCGFTSIRIPESVTSLGGALFIFCRQLRTATLPGNLKIIPTQMFDGCTLLTDVKIPDAVTEIGFWAFKDCKHIESITIPAQVSTMGEAFVNCDGLKAVTFNGPSPREMAVNAFSGVTATVYYYRGWTAAKMQNYGGNLKWVSLGSGVSFTDVANPSDYFYNPVYWAVENGITTGRTPTTFDPYGQCTRGHIVTFLWRAFGKPEPNIDNPFDDVKKTDSYYDAVRWAYEKGITTG